MKERNEFYALAKNEEWKKSFGRWITSEFLDSMIAMVKIKGQQQQSYTVVEIMNHHPWIHHLYYLMKKDTLIHPLVIYLILIIIMIPSILSEPAPEPTLVGKFVNNMLCYHHFHLLVTSSTCFVTHISTVSVTVVTWLHNITLIVTTNMYFQIFSILPCYYIIH